MQARVRVRQEEGPHGLRLVGRQIVRDHMNCRPLRLTDDDLAESHDSGWRWCGAEQSEPSFSPDCVQGRGERQAPWR